MKSQKTGAGSIHRSWTAYLGSWKVVANTFFERRSEFHNSSALSCCWWTRFRTNSNDHERLGFEFWPNGLAIPRGWWCSYPTIDRWTSPRHKWITYVQCGYLTHCVYPCVSQYLCLAYVLETFTVTTWLPGILQGGRDVMALGHPIKQMEIFYKLRDVWTGRSIRISGAREGRESRSFVGKGKHCLFSIVILLTLPSVPTRIPSPVQGANSCTGMLIARIPPLLHLAFLRPAS